jgi:hypothetical protein
MPGDMVLIRCGLRRRLLFLHLAFIGHEKGEDGYGIIMRIWLAF